MPICLRDFQDLPCFYAVCGAGNFSSFTGYEPFCTVTKSTMLFKICLRDFRKRGTKEVTSKLEQWHKALPTLLLCNHQPKHLYTIYQKGIAYYFHHCNPSGCYHSHPRGASCSAISRGYRQSHGHAYPTSNTPIMQPPTKTLVYHIPEGDCILFSPLQPLRVLPLSPKGGLLQSISLPGAEEVLATWLLCSRGGLHSVRGCQMMCGSDWCCILSYTLVLCLVCCVCACSALF